MAIYPLRKLPALPCTGVATPWLEKISDELKSGGDRALLCRRTLCDIVYPQFASNWETAVTIGLFWIRLGALPSGPGIIQR